METVSIYDMSAAKRKVKKEQRAWKYIREVCSLNSSDLNKHFCILWPQYGGRAGFPGGVLVGL